MKTEINRNTGDENIRKLADLIKDIEFAMFTTVDTDGSLRSRPMATQKHEFDGELWFFTSNRSGKVISVQKDQHVNVAYADPKSQKYVSVSGCAELVTDKDKMREIWSPALRTWFPEGLNDPELGLLRVRVESAEYWDSPSSTLVHLVGFAKAMITGQRPDPGEHARMDINNPSVH